jgi:uncharacterized HAD superfamily protein/adenine/guanine phosphoribosyltransferase-like PRPP-binding protein
MTYHLFPFEKIPQNSRIVLYGAGNVGKQFYAQATKTNFCEIVLWLDKKADDILVKLPETLAGLNTDNYDFAVIAIENETIAGDVKNFLIGYEVPESKIIHYIGLRGEITFIKFAQLSECIKKNLHKLPSDIDLIVGVPRSGIIPAYMLALFLDKNVCTLTEFINNLVPDKGKRSVNEKIKNGRKKVLIVDDSISHGNELAKTKKKIENINENYEIIFLSIFALEENKHHVDYYFQIVPPPRLFQWNYMNHSFLEKACIDIDGVLCVDPTNEQNDDGEKYIDFCLNAKPLYIPSYEIYALVTSRLEKYRPQTEEWLRKHNVKYKNLYMLDLQDAETRRNLNIHGRFKAEIYSNLKDTILFIESEPHQAKEIAELTSKPVICVSTDEYFRGKTKKKEEEKRRDNFLMINRVINISLRVKTMLYKYFVQPFILNKNSKREKRFLEIGPGNTRILNFETLNAFLINETDYIGVLGKKLPFKDNSFDLIYMSHVLEHTFWHSLDSTIEEIKRILKKDGIIEIWVPDSIKIAQAYLDAENGINKNYIEKDGWFRLNPEKDPLLWFAGRMFSYGDGKNPLADCHFNVHLAAFNERFLTKLLSSHGFTNIRILKNSECRGFDHGYINLGITGQK